MRYLFMLIGAVSLGSCDYYIVNPHRHQVGHIDASRARDDFELCFEEKLFAHYTAWNRDWIYKYPPGKDSLRLYYNERFDNQGIVNQSGYITVRFIINCKGVAGAFVVESLGLDYEKKSFNSELVQHLLELTKAITLWHPFTHGDSTYDSFTHLTFKIDNGELLEILP